MRAGILVAAALLALALAGCAEEGEASHGGTLRGTALVGPTCPVERDPPDPACADRPYEGDLVATPADRADEVAARFATGADGRFEVRLPAGTYVVRSPPGTGLPHCESQPVAVPADGLAEVDVACDSGIR